MTQIHWLNSVSANFDTAADWTGGVVPGSVDDAILDAAGSPFTVTALTNETVNSIQTAANATLAIDEGTFTAATGTGSGANAGTITVDSASFLAGGTLMNTGVIRLNGPSTEHGHPDANLTVEKALTLDGGGTVSMIANRGLCIIEGKKGSHAVLTNIDNTISGSGQIGPGGFTKFYLTLINDAGGVIDANIRKGVLFFAFDQPSTNAGLMEATGGGALSIETTTIDNTGGTIEATGGGTVVVSGGTIVGGALFAGSGSLVELINPTIVTDATLSIAAGGELDIYGSTILTTGGAIANAGTIQLSSKLVLDTNASLSGGGTVVLSGTVAKLEGITGSVVLTNVDNTISGVGLLGGGDLTLINDAAGVIDANIDFPLVIDTGAMTIANAGLIEATDTGIGVGVISSPIANTGTLETAGGTLTVNGAVTGPDGSAVIEGGTLDFNSGFNEKVTFVGGAGVLGLAKSLNFHRAITGFSATGGTTLDLGDVGYVSPGEATYSGTKSAGVLTVTDGTHTALINLKGDYQGVTFTASSDHNGGTIVVASTAPSAAAAHQFIAAAASLVGGAGGSMSVAEEAARPRPTMLARPGVREA